MSNPLHISKYKSRWVRRLAIVATFPIAVVLQAAFVVWNALIEFILAEYELVTSAAREWRKP